MRTSDTIDKLSAALAKAQGAFEGAARSSENPHFRSKYADLAAVVDATREALAENSLAVVQGLGSIVENRLSITTRLIHASGQWIESELQIPLSKIDPQGFGSASTYGRRYALMALLGVPAVDDAEAAMERKPEKKAPAAANTIHEDGDDWPGCPLDGVEVLNANRANKAGKGKLAGELVNEIPDLKDQWDVETFVFKHTPEIATWPKPWRVKIANELRLRCEELNVNPDELKPGTRKAA